MQKTIGIVLLAILCLTLLGVEPALAGPGGAIAHAAFETFWGRILLAVLTVLFLPLILYVTFLEKRAERRTRKDLRFMSQYSPLFDWLTMQQRAKSCFFRVHSSWEQEDLTQTSEWMTEWYWQNQQTVYLDRWRREGLVNVCTVKKIKSVRPLLFVHTNHGEGHDHSVIVISIEANMRDYLQERTTGKIVEGSKRYKDVETIWSFTLENGCWRVSDIEEGRMSLTYAKMVKELPKIDSTIVTVLRA